MKKHCCHRSTGTPSYCSYGPMHHVPLHQFIGPEGHSTKSLIFFSHKQGVILADKRIRKEPRAKFDEGGKGKVALCCASGLHGEDGNQCK